MAFGNTTTTFAAMIKEYYRDNPPESMIYQKNVLLGLLPKKTDATGAYTVSPIIVGAGQGRSNTFATAQSMAALSGDVMARWKVTLVENHADAMIPSQLLMETMNNRGAFLEAGTTITDNQLDNFANDLSFNIYRSSSGARGQISSTTTIASSTLKLATKADAANFAVGMQLDLAAAETTGNVRAYGTNSHGLYVTAVDFINGTLTVGTTPVAGGTACNISDAADGIPTAATGDYIFVTGDRNNKMAGFRSWVPFTAPTSGDSFFGLDRSTNPAYLAGTALDGTAGSQFSSVLEDAIAQVASLGGELTHFFMHPKTFGALSKELGSKAQLVEVKTAMAGYKGISIVGNTGEVVCMPDRMCPADMIAGIKLDAWQLLSVGEPVRIWDLDGLDSLRTPNASGIELRFYSFAQLLCTEPRSNINIKILPV